MIFIKYKTEEHKNSLNTILAFVCKRIIEQFNVYPFYATLNVRQVAVMLLYYGVVNYLGYNLKSIV